MMRQLQCAWLLTVFFTLHANAAPESAEINAWREFTSQLETAGVEILTTYPQPYPLDQAEGVRYLLQQLSLAIKESVVSQPDQIALLRVGATTIDKWGLDGSDAKYQGANVDSTGQYRLSGQLGSARLFALQLARMEGKYQTFGAMYAKQLQLDQAGRFELLISREKPKNWKGDWLKMDPAVDRLLIREYFSDWQNERPGTYHLERLDAAPNDTRMTTENVLALLQNSAARFATRSTQWESLINQARKHLVNRIHIQAPSDQGLSSNFYGNSWFKVGADEALIIEMEAPDALLWSVQLGNVWWESLDYINHTSSYNDSQAIPSSDGKYRFVLSHSDPGVPNWLNPTGHIEGAMMFRIQGAKEFKNPSATLTSLTDLHKHLPGDSAKINPQQRAAEIAQRRRHAAIRWAP